MNDMPKYNVIRKDIDGQTYYIYIPENIREGTNLDVSLVYPGHSGIGNTAPSIENVINESDGQNRIFIYNKDQYTAGRNGNKNYNILDFLMDEIRDEYNVTLTTSNVDGYSASGDDALFYAINKINNGSENIPKSVLLIDPINSNQGIFDYSECHVEDFEALAENNVDIILFSRRTTIESSRDPLNHIQFYKDATDAGVHTLLVVSNHQHSADNHDSVGIYNAYGNDGWNDYFEGNISFEDIKNLSDYSIYMVDDNGNGEFINLGELDSLDSGIQNEIKNYLGGFVESNRGNKTTDYSFLGKLEDLISRADSLPEGVIRTSYLAALTYANEIRATIRGLSMSILGMLGSFSNGESTTEVPSGENDVIREMINSILKMLANIEAETRTIEDMAYNYEDVDKKLKNISERLLDSDVFDV